jgi:translation elongation factor EF-4
MFRWHQACVDEIPKNCLVFVTGTKLDIGNFTEDMKEKIDLFCNQNNCEHHLVSAKTGEGISKLFDCILKNVSRVKSLGKDSVKLSSVIVKEKKECCKG